MALTLTLAAHDGPLRGMRFTFRERDTALIGRAPDCRLRLPVDDPTASRHHCLIELAPPRAWLRDLGSRNGTLHNGRDLRGVADPVALSVGDWIRVGDTLLRVEGGEGGDVAHDATLPSSELPPPAEDGAEEGVPGHELLELLGSGGGGVVHRARRRADGAIVAVKRLRAADDAPAYARVAFAREVAAMQALRHPHVVALYEHGAAGGAHYFTMAFCAGGSAQDLLDANPEGLPVARAVAIAVDALSGLDAAHRAGFVHRDVKPGNVLLAGDKGPAMIGDLGLAKSFVGAGLSGVTVAGAVAGTLAYMPREQITAYRTLGPTGDVWSLGATLYALLTGVAPRGEPRGRDAIAAVLSTPPVPLRHREPSVPEAVAAAVDRALRDDPAERFARAADFRDALLAARATPEG
jgi:serine/threonine protein kinase